MAKASTKKKTQSKPAAKKVRPKLKVVKAENTSAFELFDFTEVPARSRTGGGMRSPYPFGAMVVGQGFFVPASIDASNYTDETEAAAAQKEECRRVANRLAGATRRFTKQHDGYKFAVRTTQNADGVWGSWVGRVEADEGKSS